MRRKETRIKLYIYSIHWKREATCTVTHSHEANKIAVEKARKSHWTAWNGKVFRHFFESHLFN